MPLKSSANSYELLAVVLTALGKFLWIDWLNQKFWFVSTACVGWLIYVCWQLRSDPQKVKQWGFRKAGFLQSLRYLLPFALLSLTVFMIYGYWSQSWLVNWHILPILLLYPLWGTVQHFLLLALVAGNLNRLQTPKLPQWAIIMITAALFSAVHYPSAGLMAATLALAGIYVITYIKFENLWALGLVHGWLGGCFYYLVLGRDTWLEFVQALR